MAEPIEGVKLDELVSGVEAEIIEAKQQVVRRVIKGIYSDLAKWEIERKDAIKKIASLDERIVKGKVKIDELRKGNWSALPEMKDDTRPEKAAE